MIAVEKDFSLKHLNTFGIDASAKFYAQIRNADELRELLSKSEFQETRKMILGGGSNILFTQYFPGLIIHNMIKGIEEKQLDENKVLLKIGAWGSLGRNRKLCRKKGFRRY